MLRNLNNLKKYLLLLFILVAAIVPSFAEEAASEAPAYSGSDFIWLLLGAFLVFWMQAGFAMVETGKECNKYIDEKFNEFFSRFNCIFYDWLGSNVWRK